MPDGRTEVLYLAPWIDLGGSDKGTLDWFAALDRARLAPSLITTQRSPNRWLHRVEPYAEEVWVLPDVMAGDDMPEFILGFIESRGVEVVHIMNSRLGIDLLPDMATLPRPPATVVQLHAEEPGHGGYVSYAAARYAGLIDCFSVTSDHLATTLRERYDVAPQRIEVIRTGVDAGGEFDPAAVQPIEGVGATAPAILWPGRLVEQKDPLLTLEVVRLLHGRDVEFELHMVGDGWLREEVHRRADELELRDVVRFHPPTQEIARWLAAADVTLMTSAYEGVPYVIYESLAMGVPVVAPALAGNVEVMDADGGVLIDAARRRRRVRRRAGRTCSPTRRAGRRSASARARGCWSRSASRRCAAGTRRCTSRLIAARAAGSEPPPPTAVPEPLRFSREPAPERSVAVVVPCFGHGRVISTRASARSARRPCRRRRSSSSTTRRLTRRRARRWSGWRTTATSPSSGWSEQRRPERCAQPRPRARRRARTCSSSTPTTCCCRRRSRRCSGCSRRRPRTSRSRTPTRCTSATATTTSASRTGTSTC